MKPGVRLVAVAAVLALAFSGCLGGSNAGTPTATTDPTPSTTPEPTPTGTNGPGQPREPVTSDHAKDYDLGNINSGKVQQATGTGVPLTENTRLVASFTQPQGAAVILNDWTRTEEGGSGTDISIFGAFLKDGRILNDAPDSWFYGRVVYLMGDHVEYAYAGQDATSTSQFITALDEAFWADRAITRGRLDEPAGQHGRNVAIIVAWKMPEGATDLALAFCVYCGVNKEDDQETALLRLASETNTTYVAPVLGESDQATFAYWATHSMIANARMVPGLRNVEVEDVHDAAPGPQVWLNRSITAKPLLSDLKGFSEFFLWWYNSPVPAAFRAALTDGKHTEGTWRAPTPYQSTGNTGIHLRGINSPANFTNASFWIERPVWAEAPDSEVTYRSIMWMYVVQTDLDVGAALGKKFPAGYSSAPGVV